MRIIKVAQSTIKTPSLSTVTMFKPYTLSGELWFMDSTTGVTVRYLAACQTNPLRDSPFIIPRYTRATTEFALVVHVYSHYVHKKSRGCVASHKYTAYPHISFSMVFRIAFYKTTSDSWYFEIQTKIAVLIYQQAFFVKTSTGEYLR